MSSSLVSCVAWVPRGRAKADPEKVSLSKEDLKKLLEENRTQLGNSGDDVSDEGEAEPERKRVKNDDDVVTQYDLNSYDDDVGDERADAAAGLANLVTFASNDEDDYLDAVEDEDASDASDEHVRPDDNLIAVGHVEGDHSILEIYVFNQNTGDLYVHHDCMLQSQPLCMEWMDFDPSEESETTNLLAVGSVDPTIEVWDVDVVNSLEPAFQLGRRRKKKSGSGHTDAVLDLSWNKLQRNLLGSCSADRSIIVWDLTVGTALSCTENITEKVQSLEWHLCEAPLLLSGSYDGWVGLVDCRRAAKAVKTWTVDGEVERVLWNVKNPFHFMVSTDKGFVHQFDSRGTDPIWNLSAHRAACTGLCMSNFCGECLATSSTDGKLKLWDIGGASPSCIVERKLNVGKTLCLSSSPDAAFTFCFGGDKRSHYFDVEDLGELSAVQNQFGKHRSDVAGT